jgi:membrane protease YdiL (CAAX protease family)
VLDRLKRRKRELPEYLKVPWGVRDIVVFVLAWFGSQLIIGLGLALLSSFLPPVKQFRNAIAGGNVDASFVLNLGGIAIGLGLIALFLRKYKVNWSAVGWRRVNLLKMLKYLFAALIIFVVMANVALVVVKLLVPSFDANQAQTNDFTNAMGSHQSLAFIALVLLPPIFEETVFRGFIFPALSKRAGIIWGAVLSSILFGAAHGQPNLFVYTSILGLLLCFMYVKTRSIVPGVLLHMINNYLAFLALSGK